MNSQKNSEEPNDFNWPLAYEAEKLLRRYICSFLDQNKVANRLVGEMGDRTGTDFYEWVDHFSLNVEHAEELRAVGLVREVVETPADTESYYHPRAMMPRVLLERSCSSRSIPASLAIRTESLADVIAKQNVLTEIHGDFGAGLRKALLSDEANHQFLAVERLGYRGFLTVPPKPEHVEAVIKVRELWRARKRDFANDAEGVAHALGLQRQAIRLVGPDVACELFFAEERFYWESRNRAGQLQKRRQDSLGLGWSNHDHHTFRSSRRFFADLIEFLLRFGFQKRERYYAGARGGLGRSDPRTLHHWDHSFRGCRSDAGGNQNRFFDRKIAGGAPAFHSGTLVRAPWRQFPPGRYASPGGTVRFLVAPRTVGRGRCDHHETLFRLCIPEAGFYRSRTLAGKPRSRQSPASKESDHRGTSRRFYQKRRGGKSPGKSSAKGRF